MLILPFTPLGRQNMVSWMAADSDPGSYGDTVVYTFPSGRNVDGPTQVFAQINQDPVFSAQRTLLGSGGSTVVFGDFLVIPINDSLLYVQPVYVRSTQANSIPELKRVIVVNGNEVGIGNSLSDALAASTSGQTGGGNGGGGGTPTGTIDQQIQDLLNQALQHFAAAQAALTAGNLGTYQSETRPGTGAGPAGERPGGPAGRDRWHPRFADPVAVRGSFVVGESLALAFGGSMLGPARRGRRVCSGLGSYHPMWDVAPRVGVRGRAVHRDDRRRVGSPGGSLGAHGGHTDR